MKWKECVAGKYELYIDIDQNNPIAVIKDYKVYIPTIWKNRMMETPKSFAYDFQCDHDVQLLSDNLDEAKEDVESIIIKKCKDFILTISEKHRQLDELEEYYKNIIDKITVGQSENL